MRVVICDDDPVLRDIVATMAEVRGYEIVAQANDAQEALDVVRADQPDVVVLDLEMPGMSGLDAIPLLLQAAPACQVMVFTAHDDQRDAALDAGAHDAFVKTELLRLDAAMRRWDPART
jgi:two-component system secretion response regulator SsrB